MIDNENCLRVHLDHVVHPGLRLTVEFGLKPEIGVLFGASGAGKSTILRLLTGLNRPDRGSIRLFSTDLFDSARSIDVRLRDRRIGLIFQDDLLFPHLNVAKNITFGIAGWTRTKMMERLGEVVELCGVNHLLDRDPSTLSGGERQRVGLARALAPRPRLLLCDEPVGALDLAARFSLLDRIKRVQRAESIPLLYVTHSTDEAMTLGDRLLLLAEGRIVADGLPLDVLSSRESTGSIKLRNLFEAVIESNDPDDLETTLRLVRGPRLIIPRRSGRVGDPVRLSIDADEIVLARGPVGELSARNLVEGTVERVVTHGHQAEVLVRTDRLVWGIGVVKSAVDSLGLIEGTEVRMIIKSRSCRVIDEEST